MTNNRIRSKKWFIDQTDQRMCEWAYAYLASRFNMPPRHIYESAHVTCTRFLDNLSSENYALLAIKMQAAWRQKQYRDKQKDLGKKQCTFILSTKSSLELDRLAKELGESLNETLERVINKTYIENKNQKKQQRLKKSFQSA